MVSSQLLAFVLVCSVLETVVGEVVLHHDTHDSLRWCRRGACIRKCCPQDQLLVNKTCVDEPEREFTFKSYDGQREITDERVVYHVIHSNSCGPAGRFRLSPDDEADVYYVQRNGTLLKPNDVLMPTVAFQFYCLENILVSDGVELSVMVCYDEEDLEATADKQNACTGMIISTPFLLITFVVYFLLPERNVHRRALMSYVFTLLVAYITLVTIQLYPGQFPEVTCHVLGHLVIFFFLVSFFWMNVMCIDMWLAFSGMRTVLSKQTAERKRFLIYCLYAWGVPTVHTLIVFLINTYGDPDASYYPGIGKRRCYLGEELPTFYYFYLPMAILIGINIVLFIATTVRIQRIKRETSMLKHSESKRHSYEDDKQKFNLYLKLMFAMGVNWTMELVSWAVDWKVKETPTFIWYLTDFTNAMYGLLIFMIFVFKKKIWKSLQKRYYVFVGKPHLAHTMTQSSGLATRTSNYSTTETNLNSDYRLNQLRGDRPEESGLTAA